MCQSVELGLLRLVGWDEIPPGALRLPPRGLAALGFAELTPAGRRALARTYGLTGVVAGRHQGLIGGERGRAGRRLSLRRSLAHTLGVNDVFVALALAARTATLQGGDEAQD